MRRPSIDMASLRAFTSLWVVAGKLVPSENFARLGLSMQVLLQRERKGRSVVGSSSHWLYFNAIVARRARVRPVECLKNLGFLADWTGRLLAGRHRVTDLNGLQRVWRPIATDRAINSDGYLLPNFSSAPFLFFFLMQERKQSSARR